VINAYPRSGGLAHKMIDAFYALGDEFPDIAAEIYAVCTVER